MISSFLDLVLQLERHHERAPIEGDLDLENIDYLLQSVYSYEHQITPDLARRAKHAIDGLYDVFSDNMQGFVKKFGVIREGRRALQGVGR